MGPILRIPVLFLVLLVGGKLVWGLSRFSESGDGSLLWWATLTSGDIGFALPFVLFALGVGLACQFDDSRRRIRTGLAIAVALSALSYVLVAWVAPTAHYRFRVNIGSATAEDMRFGPDTPPGLLDNLRFVEANPPQEFSLSVEARERHPPNLLRWLLHRPVAFAVFGLINAFLGLLSARLTANLRRQSRRNARAAIGVLGGIAFFACVGIASPIEPFLRDGTLRSGVLSAWAPLALPLTQALLLYYLIQRRRE